MYILILRSKHNETTNPSNTTINNRITHTRHYIQSTQYNRDKRSTDRSIKRNASRIEHPFVKDMRSNLQEKYNLKEGK